MSGQTTDRNPRSCNPGNWMRLENERKWLSAHKHATVVMAAAKFELFDRTIPSPTHTQGELGIILADDSHHSAVESPSAWEAGVACCACWAQEGAHDTSGRLTLSSTRRRAPLRREAASRMSLTRLRQPHARKHAGEGRICGQPPEISSRVAVHKVIICTVFETRGCSVFETRQGGTRYNGAYSLRR
jgi:hypothetical protein